MKVATGIALIAYSLALTLISPSARATRIAVDPGHGGSDPGAVGCGLEEKAVTLDTARRLRDLLQAAGFEAILTRDADVYVGLSARASYANAQAAARFVSIHANSASSAAATGTETYCARNGSANSFALRDSIQREMIASWGLRDRGGKTANFTVLTATAMPATLSELGFIVNCDNDATYLASAAQRQEAALAHLHAIQRHLGLPLSDPGSDPPPPPPPARGELKGVIFEDRGAGTADMSLRLPGALVSAAGESSTAAADGAAWSLSLPEGTYNVIASLEGYQDGQRTCTVNAGAVTWCSMGLSLVASSAGAGVDAALDDASTDAPVDSGPSPDAATASEPSDPLDAPEPTLGDADVVEAEQVDVVSLDGPSSVAHDPAHRPAPSSQRVELGQGMGCRQGASPGLASGLLLLALLLWWPRRRGALLGALAVLSLASVARAQEARPILGPARVVLAGDMSASLLSPDGQRVAFGDAKLRGLFVVDVDSGALRVVSQRARAAYLPRWSDDGRGLILRLADRPFADEPREKIDLSGAFKGPWRAAHGRRVVQQNDRVELLDGKRRVVLAPADDRFFAPQLSPDGQVVVLQGLRSGLYVYRIAERRFFYLGAGDHPRFGGDGRWLVFDRSQDDGQDITGSDLYISDLRHPRCRTWALTHSADHVERYPSLSADGGRLAYLADGALWVAELRLPR